MQTETATVTPSATGTDLVLILCNCPDEPVARHIAEQLLHSRLAACINLQAGVQSMYRWQGNIEQQTEVTLQIKAPQHHFNAISQTILTLHPYTVPEIIAIPLVQALPQYLDWLHEECRTDV